MAEADAGPISGANTSSTRDVHKQKHHRPVQEELSFNWNAPNKYVQLHNFEIEVINILQTKTCVLIEEEKSP